MDATEKHAGARRENKISYQLNRQCPTLAIVVPCYNEQEALPAAVLRLTAVVETLATEGKAQKESFILFVDDGSVDATWDIISKATVSGGMVHGIRLSRNFGHQNALLAGLMHVRGSADCVVTIDADLQQDEQAIREFLGFFGQGYDVVNGVRDGRGSDGLLKRTTASLFYSLMRLLGVKLARDQADFRLLGAIVLDSLADFQEVNLFLRGIIPSMGFKTVSVPHRVVPRKAGSTKYSWPRMFSFALNGITSFSIMPIRLIALIGVLIFLFSAVMSCFVLLTYFRVKVVPGWASTVLPIYFIGGIQLLSIAIIGEYIGKAYLEVKRRPRYIIEKTAGKGE
jgi:glycosyltransferase involved in cell wall biosynthesis